MRISYHRKRACARGARNTLERRRRGVIELLWERRTAAPKERTKGMARKLCKIIAALVSAAMLALPGAAFAAEAEKPYAEGRILVKLARTEER